MVGVLNPERENIKLSGLDHPNRSRSAAEKVWILDRRDKQKYMVQRPSAQARTPQEYSHRHDKSNRKIQKGTV
jgi:hypothetical protein